MIHFHTYKSIHIIEDFYSCQGCFIEFLNKYFEVIKTPEFKEGELLTFHLSLL